MSSLENLTDGEIRTKLAQLGYPVGPITATTRKVLLKKLKHLMEEGKSPGSLKKDRSSLTKYSSDESEDDSVSNTRNRRSMPPPPPKNAQKPTTVKRRSLSRRSQDLEDDTINLGLDDESVNSDFPTPSASSTFNSSELISGSRSSANKYSPKNVIAPINHKTSPDNHRRNNNSAFSSFSTNFQSRFSTQKQDAFDTGSDTDGIDEVESTHPSPSKTKNSYSSYIPSIGGSTVASKTRSRFQPQSFTSGNDYPRFSPKSVVNTDNNSQSSPFSSDFVRRLAAASANKSGSGLPPRLLDVKESDDEDSSSTRIFAHQSQWNSKKGATSSLEGKIWRNATTVSMVLLFIVAIFFCAVGVMYLNVRFKETPITTTETNFPVCKHGEKPGATCILNNEIQQTMKMFREVYEVLNEKAVQFACGSDLISSALSEEQITQLLVVKLQESVWHIEKHFGNIRVLIGANPQWGVEVKETNLVREYNLPSPSLPLGCYLYSVFYGIVGSALRLVVVLGVLLGMVKAGYWWMDRQERNRQQVFKMVENIIEILSTHQQSSAGDNYLAISHVRDQLIAPHQRDKMAAVWDAAVSYLEENDSRVRTEVQQVAGEEFRVWRWLPGPKPNGMLDHLD
ncbi:uncharacterized protein LOC128994991 isoform X2 [Macrosteles quadrilineatus]|uniref:uncharacterized protein LOC128994991 isoform X2 n=1 Tax=Macrosteles quadrilineatus TaxID=74068 RepID=UPI0023E1CA9D|nr:uncharacterized protein LOC128994991 isoform X2 [Macrosteles quadrilineatus]